MQEEFRSPNRWQIVDSSERARKQRRRNVDHRDYSLMSKKRKDFQDDGKNNGRSLWVSLAGRDAERGVIV